VQAAYDKSEGKAKDPYCIAIAYTDHLAVKDVNKRIPKNGVIVGGNTPVNILIEDDNTNQRYALWNNIVTGEDWFVECFFLKDGGDVTTDKRTITKDKCTLVQRQGASIGYYDSVNIDVSNLPAETGTIILKVNWVNRMRAGISLGDINFIAVCTRVWWETSRMTNKRQNEVMIHEVGHQIGMVPFTGGPYNRGNNTEVTGMVDKTKLDPPEFQYTGKGHEGSHCSSGLTQEQRDVEDYRLIRPVPAPDCVMYGSTNDCSSFCTGTNGCAKAVKKLDLSNGVK
jgi:type VI secretion system secreted protein VgrG